LGIYSEIPTIGIYLDGGKVFKLDFNIAKRIYYGCFNTIITTVGRQMNEFVMLLHMIKTLFAKTYEN